ncbi:MAG: toll/interleukin-1 receptor domain-containing protein [Dehalococcoidia bacterium]|nr:MAG: toll/interleukin-1 receptor domain-containing protein [Dehalococcoidia bacterium]
MADAEHVAVVRNGTDAIAQWRQCNPTMRLDLSGAQFNRASLRRADLSEADLSGASLWLAELVQADLSGADLSGADLRAAQLLVANLSGANLTRAKLTFANLLGANLSGAKLIDADVTYANFLGSKLVSVDLTRATVGSCCLDAIDLSQVSGLTTVTHGSPSGVGVLALLLSASEPQNRLPPDVAGFFRAAGVPEEILEVVPTILAEVEYHTCFVAYGEPDLAFARRLCQDLESRGVSCWQYDMDATVGEQTWEEIGRERRAAEKFVVLCSLKALVRPGVLKEVEEQVDEDVDKLMPVSLDGNWTADHFEVRRANRNLKPYLADRNYADFANLSYEEALERLLRGLRREAEQKES